MHVSIMYLRTTRRKNKDGSVVEYYQLAHNERHPATRKPVARIIHGFGRADQLDREQLVRLCKSIARVCSLKVTDLLDDPPWSVLSTGRELFRKHDGNIREVLREFYDIYSKS